MPPENTEVKFIAAPEVGIWVCSTFLNTESELYNLEHEHLTDASIGFLWAFCENKRGGKQIIGTAEIFKPKGDRWVVERQKEHIRNLFFCLEPEKTTNGIPDFIITLDAEFCINADDASFCALVEHELYHCFYKTNEYGEPKFDEHGKRFWVLKSHDVEEFIGVVSRYGLGAVSKDVAKLVEAANKVPQISQATLAGVCGSCH
jgi:hypothetical protein